MNKNKPGIPLIGEGQKVESYADMKKVEPKHFCFNNKKVVNKPEIVSLNEGKSLNIKNKIWK